jgi:hypothetical protein
MVNAVSDQITWGGEEVFWRLSMKRMANLILNPWSFVPHSTYHDKFEKNLYNYLVTVWQPLINWEYKKTHHPKSKDMSYQWWTQKLLKNWANKIKLTNFGLIAIKIQKNTSVVSLETMAAGVSFAHVSYILCLRIIDDHLRWTAQYKPWRFSGLS